MLGTVSWVLFAPPPVEKGGGGFVAPISTFPSRRVKKKGPTLGDILLAYGPSHSPELVPESGV
jgi:hypothetical protein